MLKTTFNSLNNQMERFVPILTPLGVIFGLVFPFVLKDFKFLVTPLFAFITFTGALGMNIKEFAHVIKKPKPIILSLILSHIFIPLLVFSLSKLIFINDPDMVVGFVLLYAIPTAVVGYMWTSIYKGNGALSLTIILIDTMLSPLLTPLTIKILTRSDVSIDTSSMMLSLLYLVVLPSILGVAINTLSNSKAKENIKPLCNPFTKVALILVVAINVSQIAKDLVFDKNLIFAIPVNLLFISSGFALSLYISKKLKLKKEDCVTLTYSVGMRNISAALVLAIDFFPPTVSLPVTLGVIMQQSTAAFMGTLLFRQKENKDA